MATLVTGGAGAIGAWVSRALAESGEDVVAFSTAPREERLKGTQVKAVRGDVRDMATLLRTARRFGVDRVIHMASAISPEIRRENPTHEVHVAVDGWCNVLEIARALDFKRVLYASSRAVYAWVDDDQGGPPYRKMHEEDATGFGPDTDVPIYSAEKTLAEQLGRQYHRAYGVDFAALRFGSTYGPGKLGTPSYASRPERLGVDALIDAVHRGQPARAVEATGPRTDYTYYLDVADATARLCLKPEPLQHRAYNVSIGAGYNLRDFAAALRRAVPAAQVEISEPAEPPRKSFVLDIGWLQEETGFRPLYDPQRAVDHYLESMRAGYR